MTGAHGAGRDRVGGMAWPWGPCGVSPAALLRWGDMAVLPQVAEDEGQGAGDKDTMHTQCHRVSQSDSRRGTAGKAQATNEKWMIPPGAAWAEQESPRGSGGASWPAPPWSCSSSSRSSLVPRAPRNLCLPHPQGHAGFGQSRQETEICKAIKEENSTTEKIKPKLPTKTGFVKVKCSFPVLV